ncbi:hypothetical protein JOM56_002106 [Amanita muscaria]
MSHRCLHATSRLLDSWLVQCSYSHKRKTCRRAVPWFRTASTSSGTSHPNNNPYPFPAHRNPTPYQLFHLPINATEEDIKARYYDLVRIYHPDKASGAPPEIAHARFQAITAAYDILRKRRGQPDTASSGWKEGGYPTAAAWRAASQARRAQELYSGKRIDDRWKDRVFVLSVIMAVGAFVFQTTSTRREAMTEVVARSRHAATNVYDRKRTPPADSAVEKDNERLSA